MRLIALFMILLMVVPAYAVEYSAVNPSLQRCGSVTYFDWVDRYFPDNSDETLNAEHPGWFGNDNDDDGLDNYDECEHETDPLEEDTDGDGLIDGDEVSVVHPVFASDPTVADVDEDGLSDSEERQHSTNPAEADTDGDGKNDKEEVDAGTDPTDAGDPPPPVVPYTGGSDRTGEDSGRGEERAGFLENAETILPLLLAASQLVPDDWLQGVFGREKEREEQADRVREAAKESDGESAPPASSSSSSSGARSSASGSTSSGELQHLSKEPDAPMAFPEASEFTSLDCNFPTSTIHDPKKPQFVEVVAEQKNPQYKTYLQKLKKNSEDTKLTSGVPFKHDASNNKFAPRFACEWKNPVDYNDNGVNPHNEELIYEGKYCYPQPCQWYPCAGVKNPNMVEDETFFSEGGNYSTRSIVKITRNWRVW